MRVLISCRPTYGHYTPLVALAAALEGARHQVIFATGEPLAETIRREGFQARTVGLSDQEVRALLPNDPVFMELFAQPRRQRMAFFSRVFSDVELGPRIRDLRRLVDEWRPELIVHESAEFAGPLAAALVDVPSVNHSFGPLVQADVMAAAATSAAPHWIGCGLPEPDRAGMYRGIYLDVVPPSLQFPHISTIPSVQRLRPVPLAQRDLKSELWLERLGARPVVTVTLGTVFNRRVDLFRAVVDGLGDMDADVIVATGHTDAAETLGEVPANVQVHEWVPWTKTLEHTSVVVSHGGASSTLGPLAFGIPLVVIPLGADHFTNAEVTERVGVATVLDADTVDPSLVRAAVEWALTGPARRAAGKIAAEISAMPAPEEVVGVLEDWLATQ